VPGYAFANARAGQVERLRAVRARARPGHHRASRGRWMWPGLVLPRVRRRCRSIAAWPAEQVGPSGSMLATDLDVTVLPEQAMPGVEGRRQ
jgi:hypothetical protein